MRRRRSRAATAAAGVLGLALAGCFVDVPTDPSAGDVTSAGGTSTGAAESAATDPDPTDPTDPSTSSTTTSTPSTSSTTSTSTGPDTTAATTGCDPSTWYPDKDGDGYGDPAGAVQACDAPPGHVAAGGDCDDTRKSAFPGAAEVCDKIDNDCDGYTDEHSPDNSECGGCSMAAKGGRVYHVCPAAGTFAAARAACDARYADLVVLEALAEHQTLALLGVPGDGNWWIGLSDQANEGDFRWVDGAALDWDQATWSEGEPNDLEGEDCVHFTPGGEWNDAACDIALGFVCEGPPVGA